MTAMDADTLKYTLFGVDPDAALVVDMGANGPTDPFGNPMSDFSASYSDTTVVIDSLTHNPAQVKQGQTLTLTAAVTGTPSSISFYRDNGDATFDVADDELLGTDTNSGDGWSVNVSIPGKFTIGTYTYFAQGTYNGGASTTNVATTTGEVIGKKGGRNLLAETTGHTTGDGSDVVLLTATAHEVGHALGYEHSHDGVMADTLSIGERRLPLFKTDLIDDEERDPVFFIDTQDSTAVASDGAEETPLLIQPIYAESNNSSLNGDLSEDDASNIHRRQPARSPPGRRIRRPVRRIRGQPAGRIADGLIRPRIVNKKAGGGRE